MTNETLSYDGVIWRKGKKTILRPVERTDLPLLQKFINDPNTNHWLGTVAPVSEANEAQWFESINSKSGHDLVTAICLYDGTLIGTMGLHRVNLINRNAVTGTMIGKDEHRGRGYATDAKMLLLDYAFNALGLHKVISHVIAFNGRSLAYARKCGYQEEARLRQQFFRDGVWHDEVILAVFRDDWLPLWEEYHRTA